MSRIFAALLVTLPLVARAAEPLTLAQALAEAERASPDLAAARARLDQARAQVAKARAAHLPLLRAAGTYTRNSEAAQLQLPVGFAVRDLGVPTSSPGGLPGQPTTLAAVPSELVSAPIQVRDQLGAQLDVSQAILAPQVWYTIEAAGAGARAAGATLETARRELRFGVAQAYYAAAAAEQHVAVQERQVAVARAHEHDAATQVAAGVQPRIAQLRASMETVRAEQDLVRAQGVREATWSALAALLGRAESSEFVLEPPPAPALPAEASTLEDEAVRRRPEIAAFSAAADAAAASRRAATARYFPALGAFGQARWANVAGFTGKEEGWAAGLALTWTLFDGGAREADRRDAGARLAEAEAGRASAATRARDEVRRARIELQAARANLAKAEQQLAIARESQRVVEVSFKAGQASSLEATDANEALTTAELGAVNERLAADLSALRLLRAAGL
jgi:outer membrane protein TolC